MMLAIFNARPNAIWLRMGGVGVSVWRTLTSGANETSKCWNCDEPSASSLFCRRCDSLQRPNARQNFFQIIGVDEHFRLDESALAKKFKDLQKVLHPDKFNNKTRAEQKISEEYSSLVNKAYSTLLHPLSRGTYILQLKGHELPEKTDLESGFLHEIMERNEEVECADTPEEILRIEREIKSILVRLQNELNDALITDDFSAAIKTLVQMKYYISIEDQIKNVIRSMNIVR
ncbi:iron-sulfur cluster co-chaperone protein HscB-like protein, mitochondrial [Arctopsyche grandis]|uniref:iron-sulfur cluster co-chaperone protein HscB-like protein, mitochondrial n=1 Tax=Arctopsyche grandis TaxID=121162 RepID=UPI00406D9E80